MRKRIVAIVLCTLTLLTIFSACDDGKDYTCGYCGREMSHYYSYIGNRYTCYSCAKALK